MIYFIFVCRYGLLWNFNLNGYLFSVLDDYVWSIYMKYDILFIYEIWYFVYEWKWKVYEVWFDIFLILDNLFVGY